MDILVSSFPYAQEVDATIVLKVLVLDGEYCGAQHARQFGVRDHDTALVRKGAEDLPVDVVEVGGGTGPIALQLRHLRQIDGVNQDQSKHHAKDCGGAQQGKRGGAGRELAVADIRLAERKAPNGLPQSLGAA